MVGAPSFSNSRFLANRQEGEENGEVTRRTFNPGHHIKNHTSNMSTEATAVKIQ